MAAPTGGTDRSIDPVAALRASTLLRGFTEVGIRILAAACEQRSVGRGAYAFRAGDESTALLFLARGTVQLMPRGGGAPLGELGPGDSLGGFALLFGGEHLLTAQAATDLELFVLERAAWQELQKQTPQAALKLELSLARDLCERLREAQGPLREFLAWQVSRRPADGR